MKQEKLQEKPVLINRNVILFPSHTAKIIQRKILEEEINKFPSK